MSDFVDRVTVHVKGGDGGNGSAGSFYQLLQCCNGFSCTDYIIYQQDSLSTNPFCLFAV